MQDRNPSLKRTHQLRDEPTNKNIVPKLLICLQLFHPPARIISIILDFAFLEGGGLETRGGGRFQLPALRCVWNFMEQYTPRIGSFRFYSGLFDKGGKKK